MASHYKGERITELLNVIAEMEAKLFVVKKGMPEGWHENDNELAHAYTSLAIAKAKLTALQGEGDEGNKALS